MNWWCYGDEEEEGEKIQTVTIDVTEAAASQPEFSKLVPEQGTSKVFGRVRKELRSSSLVMLFLRILLGLQMIMMICRLDVLRNFHPI